MVYRIPILKKTFLTNSVFLALAVSLSAIAPLSAAPSIASPGIYNAASYALAAFPNGGIAQGSIFVVFGSGMGPATIVYNSSLPYQTSLGGTSVTVTVNGTPVPCLMYYTSAGQLAAILPSTTPTGIGTITVTYNGATSPAAQIAVVKSALGLFSVSQAGSGPGVIQNSAGAYNALTNTFQPNQEVVFWGTGLGPVAGSDATTPPVQTGAFPPDTTVTANIGGQNAVVQYAGRSGYAGEDQINVTIPSGVTGCYVPVYMTVNGVPSNFVSMSISTTGSVCSDANLYSSANLQNVASGGTLRTGGVILEQYALSVSLPGIPILIPPEESEEGTGTFSKYTAITFLGSQGGLGNLAVSSGCMVFTYSGSTYADPVAPTAGLDAGTKLNLTGPNGTQPLTKNSTGNYSATFVTPSLNLTGTAPPDFLTPGTYTLDNGTGGADIGAFKVNLTVPPPVTWSNKSLVTTVPRTQPLTITWTGGAANGMVYITGISPLAVNASTETILGAGQFQCVAPASAGTFAVPAGILSALPPSASISASTPLGNITVPGGIIIVSSQAATSATVPGLDVFLTGASSGTFQ